jgi:hypothetical protein
MKDLGSAKSKSILAQKMTYMGIRESTLNLKNEDGNGASSFKFKI